jgi:CelD/BcsL family acetyltransferase involved in cellulose biosynthesis
LDGIMRAVAVAKLTEKFQAFLMDSATDAVPHHRLPHEGRLSLVTTVHGLLALERPWQALEQSAPSVAGVFQSFAWVSEWAKIYVGEHRSAELCVITGYAGARLVFVLPLMKVRQAGVMVVKWLTDPFGQYGDILLAEGECPKAWMSQALHLLGKLRNIDVIRLRHVREDAKAGPALKHYFQDARANDAAPALDLSPFADEAAFDARYTSAQRKRRKKIRKSLEQFGPVDFNALPSGSGCAKAIALAVEEKNKWLAERGRHNRVLKCPAHVAFLKALTQRPSGEFQCVVTQMSAGDKPVSWEIGFNYQGTHYGYITSHRVDLTDLSPGRLHMDMSQRRSLNQGHKRFDLMVPNDEHKESWSSLKVSTADYFHAMSPVGWVFGLAYLRTVRPLVRKAYYASPAWLLRLANNPRTRETASS